MHRVAPKITNFLGYYANKDLAKGQYQIDVIGPAGEAGSIGTASSRWLRMQETFHTKTMPVMNLSFSRS